MEMLSFVPIILLLFFGSQCNGKPTSPSSHFPQRRQASSSKPIINPSIHTPNGTDVTSAFQTKIYIQPRIVNPDGLTTRQIMGERPIKTCESPTAEFHHSHCRHRRALIGSFRSYLVYCRERGAVATTATDVLPAAVTAMVTTQLTHDDTLLGEMGICEEDEVCIDSLGTVTWNSPVVLVANCVKKSVFKNYLSPEDFDDDEELDEDEKEEEVGRAAEKAMAILAGKTASVLVSQRDAQTPLEVNKIDLTAESGASSPGKKGIANGGGGSAPAEILQERNCTDCFELRTKKAFEDQTDDLNVAVTLVGAGSAALTGVLWVALLSG